MAAGTRWKEAVIRSNACSAFRARPVEMRFPAVCVAAVTSVSKADAKSRARAVTSSSFAEETSAMPSMEVMTAPTAVLTSSREEP